MAHTCLTCGWPHLHEPPRGQAGGASFEICPSCGFQPGVTDDDEGETPEKWRGKWIREGMPWFSLGIQRPPRWNPAEQLHRLDGKKS